MGGNEKIQEARKRNQYGDRSRKPGEDSMQENFKNSTDVRSDIQQAMKRKVQG